MSAADDPPVLYVAPVEGGPWRELGRLASAVGYRVAEETEPTDALLVRIDQDTEAWDTWDGRGPDAMRWSPTEDAVDRYVAVSLDDPPPAATLAELRAYFQAYVDALGVAFARLTEALRPADQVAHLQQQLQQPKLPPGAHVDDAAEQGKAQPMTAETAYLYRVPRVRRVVDGDTVDAVLDLGLHLEAAVRLRVLGVDTPERGMPGWADATAATTAWLERAVLEADLVVETAKADSFGRWLGVFRRASRPGDTLAAYLIATQYGVPYRRT